MPETIPVRDAHRFDLAPLEKWLERGKIDVEQMAGGQSNPTFLLKTPDGELVLRKQPPGKLLPSAHAVDREFRILSALHPTGFPVPKPVGFCEDRAVIGTPFYVMERMRGRIFRKNDLPGVSDRAAIYDAMNATLARLHSIDPAQIGLGDFGKTGSYYARQVSRWSQQWQASKTRELPALASLVEWLPKNLPSDGDEAAIAHGDFRLENLMFHESEPRVIAVFDWELSTLGPPLADLAYNVIAWSLPPAGPLSGLAGLDLSALGIPARDAYVQKWLERTGRRQGPKPFHLAFSMFRLAVILEGVLARALAGNAASAEGEAMGKLGALFADLGWRTAQS